MVKATTSAPAAVKQVAKLSCMYYGEEHEFNNYPGNPASVNYIGNYNRQSQTTRTQILTTLDGSNTQISHGVIRIRTLQH